ncbi:mechanosensitive ion channel [Puniceicoccaceae bacterium K14]|nr:mechanosensitive ion channel [Puniceicoccaceae bacterium K14]
MESETPTDFLSTALDFLDGIWMTIADAFDVQSLALELAVVVGVFGAAFVLTLVLKPFCVRVTEAIEERDDWVEGVVDWLADNLFRFLLAGLLWAAAVSLGYFDGGSQTPGDGNLDASTHSSSFILVRTVASLATLVLVSGALPRHLRRTLPYKVAFFVLAICLGLNLIGLWAPVHDGLGEMKLLPLSESTETRVTVLSLLKGILAIMIMIPLCRWLLRILDSRIGKMGEVSPVLRVLISKFVSVLVIIVAILFGISSLGVNLSALAVLGGAVGLGLGFGFQKVVSNLISGVILLTDRSIKPGDVIEVDDTYGWINKLSARYVSVITRDGTEHLIPNETLITEKVTNWSFSDDKVRVKIPFGVGYNSDPHDVQKLAIQAAKPLPRVLSDKEPVCWLTEFGDNSINFELRIWIRDPEKGVVNLKSAIYMRLWDLFKKHGIEIPYPQRDLHIRGSVPLEVKVKRDGQRDY